MKNSGTKNFLQMINDINICCLDSILSWGFTTNPLPWHCKPLSREVKGDLIVPN